ncbi:sigma-70 family RNA polymerase sigma factor [Mucilaginibacter sp. HMF5004]|uniref:sigma-70 family RNA polymerase sigma factor n=1 Tax=Mucilaginibacter rivuli TaxID=2857527 RepID=UPI001C5D7BAA|nr:sigma-70 family RNA polymerase sigma factor [Mucilaginibacter rivuli]MBW4889459.1 sigma-70 family RNA polymerase sigma factor [Mucilaginibacter rivuli]
MPVTQAAIDPNTWVNAHADYLYAFAIKRIADEEIAKDLVQDTFLAALQKVRTFEGKSSERTWLTAILKNKIVDVYRKRSSVIVSSDIADAERVQQDFFDTDGHWTQQHYPREMGVEEQYLENKELGQALKKCMEKLPALWLSVFTMKHIDDETSERICTELKVSAQNFWVIIHRAKLNLRACLQKNWV